LPPAGAKVGWDAAEARLALVVGEERRDQRMREMPRRIACCRSREVSGSATLLHSSWPRMACWLISTRRPNCSGAPAPGGAPRRGPSEGRRTAPRPGTPDPAVGGTSHGGRHLAGQRPCHHHGGRHTARAPQGHAAVRGAGRASRPARVHLHTLRHSAASFLLAAGTHTKVVQEHLATRPTPLLRTSTAMSVPPSSSARRLTGSTPRSAGDRCWTCTALLYSYERRVGRFDQPASDLRSHCRADRI
jgi:hypothetical protein